MMQAETAFLAKDFFRAASFYAKVSGENFTRCMQIVWLFFKLSIILSLAKQPASHSLNINIF